MEPTQRLTISEVRRHKWLQDEETTNDIESTAKIGSSDKLANDEQANNTSAIVSSTLEAGDPPSGSNLSFTAFDLLTGVSGTTFHRILQKRDSFHTKRTLTYFFSSIAVSQFRHRFWT